MKPPSHYAVSACACGNLDTQWSEFESHVWCEKCKTDFEPTDNGLLGLPLGLYTSSMLGISFHRLNLHTNEVEGFVSAGLLLTKQTGRDKDFTDILFLNALKNSEYQSGKRH